MNEQQTLSTIQRDLRLLKAYAVVTTALIAILWFSGFKPDEEKQQFAEIDVQRINIVEKDGKPRIILANKALAPDPIIKGKAQQRVHGNNPPGITFYNDDGTESGALLTVSTRGENNRFTATSRLVFDQFESDEVMALQYIDESGKRYAGLLVWDRPETPTTDEIQEQIRTMWKMPDGPKKWELLEKLRAQRVFETRRMFVGKQVDKSSAVNLFDRNGTMRLRLSVDSLGTPSLTFYDEKGRATYKLPDSLAASQKK